MQDMSTRLHERIEKEKITVTSKAPEITPNFLWLTKKTLVESSTRETAKWGMQFFPVIGSTEEKLASINLVKSLPLPKNLMLNYESLNSDKVRDELESIPFAALVIDEVHKLKGGAASKPSQIWKNAKHLVRHQVEKNGCYPIFLSGSIVNNSMDELWAYLHLFDPETFKSLSDFQRVFNYRVWKEGLGYTPQRLLDVLAPNMIRRRKDEVGIELPPKNFLEPESIELDKSTDLYKIHKQLSEDLFLDIEGMDEDAPLSITNLLAKLHYLRAVLLAPGRLKYNYYPVDPYTGERSVVPVQKILTFAKPYPKLEAVADTVFELYMSGESSVVFSAQYNVPLEYLKTRLAEMGLTDEVAVIKGGSPVSEIERKFQQNEYKILLCNLKAAAEGLNLHRCDEWPGGASHVLFLDRWYNPELNRQGEDRTYRIGTNKPVFIHKFFVKDSVDLFIDALEQSKIEDAKSFTESSALRVGEWRSMLHKYLG